jgi:hypothetical protein
VGARGVTTPRRRPRKLSDVHPTRRGFVLAWWSFTAMFAFLRLLTYAIRLHVAGLGNVNAGGVHIHHYLWGILLVTGVAFTGLVERSAGWRSWMGVAFGIGTALIVDEIALLIELKDVYWTGFGEVSVAAGILLVGLCGSALALTRAPHKDDQL